MPREKARTLDADNEKESPEIRKRLIWRALSKHSNGPVEARSP